MSIKIARNDFENAISVVSNSVARSGPDISSHFIIRVQDGKVTILGNLNRVFGSCPVVAEVTDDLDKNVVFTIEASRVAKMLQAVEEGVLDISLVRTGDRVTEVEVKTDLGDMQFACIDPSQFPFWDDLLAAAEETAVIAASRLSAAFSHAKMFIGADDQKTPQYSVAEFRAGILRSTDMTAVSLVWVEGTDKSTIRVHAKDIPALIAFLDKAGDSPVTVLEHERAMFIRREDGAVFGEAPFSAKFPEFPIDKDTEDQFTWEIVREEFARSFRFLLASARDDNAVLTITPTATAPAKDGEDPVLTDLVMTMTSVSGRPVSQTLKTLGRTRQKGASIPNGHFAVDPNRLLKAMSDHSSNNITLGVTQRKKGGWVRVRDDRGEPGSKDSFVTTIAWQAIPSA